MAKKPPSAYFLFCEDEREAARQACSEADPTVKVSVATVAKALGKQWEALGAEQKQRYKERAKQRASETPSEADKHSAST